FPARAVEDLLRRALVAPEERDVDAVLAEVAQRGELPVVAHLAARRVLVVAAGEVGLRLGARKVLEEPDRRFAMGRMARDARARDVYVGAAVVLVGEYHPELLRDGAVRGLGGLHQADVVVRVRHGNV